MSTHIGSIECYGIIFTEEILDHAANQLITDTDNELDGEDRSYVAEKIGLTEEYSFNGEAISIGEDGCDDWSNNGNDLYECDHIYYGELRNWSTLFKAAYQSMDDVVAELKKDYGKYLPDNFDYVHSVKHIIGTYYG